MEGSGGKHKNVEVSETTVVAEYQALRAEILARLGFQQQLVNYSLIATGLIVPIVGLIAVRAISLPGVLALLLIGPLVNMFLELIYLKHYVYIQSMANYITMRLGLTQSLGDSRQDHQVPVFSGWETHLTTQLIKPPLVDISVAFTGFAEGLFPGIGGVLYLLAFAASMCAQASTLTLGWQIALWSWAALDLLLLTGVFIVSGFVRVWGRQLRTDAEEALRPKA